MTADRTTAHALNTRAQQFVNTHPQDPVALANRLADDAVRLQDEGRFVEAEELLNRAEALLS